MFDIKVETQFDYICYSYCSIIKFTSHFWRNNFRITIGNCILLHSGRNSDL